MTKKALSRASTRRRQRSFPNSDHKGPALEAFQIIFEQSAVSQSTKSTSREIEYQLERRIGVPRFALEKIKRGI